MLMDRRTVLGGAVGLPFVPAALDAVSPLSRRVFVFDPQEGVAQIVSAFIARSFGVEVDFVREGAEQARSLVDRHLQAYGAVYWRHELNLHVAEVRSPVRSNVLRCPFSMREMISHVEAATGWTPNYTVLRP